MPRYFTIGETADYFGVSVDTIRRWESEGRITSQRTKGGHRRFLASTLAGIEEEERNEKPTLCYARVSTRDKKDDLERQANALVAYCENKGWQVELIKDIGSGLNYKKRGLNKLIDKILNEEVSRLIITDKDRLLRFGSELIFSLCSHYQVEVIVINRKPTMSEEEELVQDVLEIIQVFAARLYGKRSHRNQKLIEDLHSATLANLETSVSEGVESPK